MIFNSLEDFLSHLGVLGEGFGVVRSQLDASLSGIVDDLHSPHELPGLPEILAILPLNKRPGQPVGLDLEDVEELEYTKMCYMESMRLEAPA